MNNTTHIDVRQTSDLARLRLTSTELAAYGGQLDRILGYISQLNAVDTTGVEPTAHPGNLMDVVREDNARAGFGVESALANAPRRGGDQFLVPKVVEAS